MIDEAIQATVDAIQAARLSRGDGQPLTVLDFDPAPGGIDRPAAVGVSFGLLGETGIGVTVRIYADTSTDPASAEQAIRALTPAVDAALDVLPAPRSTWVKTWSLELNAYVCETTLEYPREDF